MYCVQDVMVASVMALLMRWGPSWPNAYGIIIRLSFISQVVQGKHSSKTHDLCVHQQEDNIDLTCWIVAAIGQHMCNFNVNIVLRNVVGSVLPGVYTYK